MGALGGAWGGRTSATVPPREGMMMTWLSRTMAAAVGLVLVSASAVAASDAELEPTDPPIVPLATYEDPVGDVQGGRGPDIVSCSIAEPWQSLVSFTFEFASDPPLSYDVETMSTDELWVGLSTDPSAVFPDDITHILGVHGATLEEEAVAGATLWDASQIEGDPVFWRVVDVEVEGPTLTLAVDRKLVGDPDDLYFVGIASAEGQEVGDFCPDVQELEPGRYQLGG
jgi:hypothetical protein